MPRAVMLSSSFLPGRGGIESYLAELCERLSPCLGVIAPARRDDRPIPPGLSYPVIGLEGRMLLPTRRVLEAIVRVAGEWSTERVLFGTPWPLGLLGGALRSRGLRYAMIVHGAELTAPASLPGVNRILARNLSGADLLLPVSEFTAARVRTLLARSSYPVPEVGLLRARVDLERFRPDPTAEEVRERHGWTGKRVVLCLGRLVKRKGIHRLIGAFQDVAARVPDAVLAVAGTGPQEARLRRRARGLQNVFFLGRVAEEDAARIYATAHVFALPVTNRWFGLDVEGLGIVLLEASACAVPCVTGRSGGTPEAVIDKETGFVIDARDRRALVEPIVWLLQHPAEAAEMGARAREHVAAKFSGKELPRELMDWLNHCSGQ
jgi:phosphatidyl-myo-inositol dimannoside synthase